MPFSPSALLRLSFSGKSDQLHRLPLPLALFNAPTCRLFYKLGIAIAGSRLNSFGQRRYLDQFDACDVFLEQLIGVACGKNHSFET